MKIAHVVSTYPPYRGGMGNVAHEYTKRLRERGLNVHVFTPLYESVEDDPSYVHRVPSPIHAGNAGFVPSLFHRLKGFDVIHLHYPFFGGAEPTVIGQAIKPHQKLVMTYHMDAVADGIKGALFNLHRKVLLPWITSRADKIFVSSRDYYETSPLVDQLGDDHRVEVMPFGVDLERFHPGDELSLRQSLGISEKDSVFVFVGGLDEAHYFKGFPVLLESLKELRSYPWKCVVIGDGELRPSFEDQVRSEGMEDRFQFLGSVSEEMLPKYLRMSDVHVFPSTRRAEAFGLVALEAAASGIPSIASELPGVRGVVLDGETGLLVPPNNSDALRESLLLLLEQVDLRERLGFSARKRAEQSFDWDPLIDQLAAVYHHLVTGEHSSHTV